MSADSTPISRRSRRALMAGALGGLAAWAASTAARVSPVEAAAGDPIRMGRLNQARGTSTTLQTKASEPTFRAVQLSAGTAVRAEATSGRAIMGVAGSNGTGVWAFSPNHYGVHARSDHLVAVRGESFQDGTGVVGVAIQGTGVIGNSSNGVGVYGISSTSYAAKFVGRVHTTEYQDISEMTTPAAPPANMARLFVRDNGSGKTELCVRFPTGAEQVIATEP